MDENKIDQLIKMELQGSYIIHGGFNSMHEGYAVLKEEIEEAADEQKGEGVLLNRLWEEIKQDKPTNASDIARHMLKTAKCGIAEMIQVAAMCKKMIDFINQKEQQS